MLKNISIVSATLLLAACGARVSTTTNSTATMSKFLVSSQDVLKAATLNLDIEGRIGNDFVVFVPAGDIERVRNAIPGSVLQVSDISQSLNQHLSQNPDIAAQIYSWDRVQTELKQWSETLSTQTDLVQYGTSTQGRPLYALHIKGVSLNATPKPAVMITGATHGNEILTVDTVMGITKHILDNLSTDRVKNILAKNDLWFVPVVSPDSYVTRQRYVDGLDPNRDFPWPDNTTHQSSRVIKAVAEFATGLDLAASIDYHSVASVIMWPWAYTDKAPAGADKFRDVARSMASTNNYDIGQISEVMYIAKGSSADYYHWKKGSMSFGIELSQDMPRTPTTGEEMAQENLESTLRFIEATGTSN